MNELQLSKDLNVITAEIQSYKQIAGQSIFEIGRRLKHVKENDLVHGEWISWLESIDMSRRHAHRFIKVYEEVDESYVTSGAHLGIKALYEIATLPEEEREKEHVTSKGETKTPDEMTVRELEELKRKLREEKEAKEQAEQQVKQARQSEEIALKKLEEEQAKEPKVVEKEVIKEVDKTDYERIERLEKEVERKLAKERAVQDRLQALEKELSKEKEKAKELTQLRLELKESQDELEALTQAQIRLKDKRMVFDNVSYLTRDLGGWMRKIRLYIIERGNVQGDKEVHRTVDALIKTFDEAKEEAYSWIEAEQEINGGGDFIDADYVEINK